jgi:hypothetical protein
MALIPCGKLQASLLSTMPFISPRMANWSSTTRFVICSIFMQVVWHSNNTMQSSIQSSLSHYPTSDSSCHVIVTKDDVWICNICCTVACLHSSYLAMSLHVTVFSVCSKVTVKLLLCLIKPWGKISWYPLDGRLSGSQSQSGCCGEKSLALQGIKTSVLLLLSP